MQRIHGRTIYAATDLVRFLACQHSTALDFKHLETPLKKAEDDESRKLIQKMGHEHEGSYLGHLRSNSEKIVREIPTDASLEERCKLTIEAMQSGVDVIYQAAFLDGIWLGYADFLRRVPGKTRLGDYGYEAVDTKLARSEKPEYIIQLSLYSAHIRSIQGVAPTSMHIVLGDGREVSFRVNEFEYYFKRAKHRFEKFALNVDRQTTAEPCSYCHYCSWRDLCSDEWESKDHLSLVANITKGQIKKLRAAGVETIKQLAELEGGSRVTRMQEDVLSRLRSQASLQMKARATGVRFFETLALEDGRGFARMPKASVGDIFFDIEGDPLYPDQLEYLFGCLYVEKGREKFRPFWAHDHAAEKIAVLDLLRFFTSHLVKHPDAHIYHYAAYEVTALKRITARYGVGEFELDQLLRGKRFVDLYKVVREGIRTSEPSYSIKNIEKFYMSDRVTEIAAGGDSIVAYERYRETGAQSELDAIWLYNQDDLKSTLLLQKWLLEIRPEDARWFSASDAGLDQEKSDKHAAAEAEREAFERRLLKGPEGEQKALRTLTAQLIDFHRRADKPAWWAVFDRMDWETDELIDDPESIGGLLLDVDKQPQPVARSVVHSYKIPAQDTKLDVGDRCRVAATAEYAGTIETLDVQQGLLSIRRGAKAEPLPASLSLTNSGPLENKDAPAAIRRFADSLVAKSHRYKAVEALLTRKPPIIKTRKVNTLIITPDKDLLSEAIDAVSNLQDSCLFIQGPPGAGKTTTSAAIIVELLKKGRKVGVASSSHKAINNLLKKVEKVALERGVSFRGIKKSSENNPESCLNGRVIADVFAYPDPTEVDLIAGTAWLFAKEKYDQCVDYLFIDEAGQVALANVVAMGLSARNLVLVGDQMQLGQPVQGVHPGESGLSVLDFLLRDQATIPPEKGIFLPITWRLNPLICKFISDAVYESRLMPHPRTADHRLTLKKIAHKYLKDEGLVFVEVPHEGCAQRSEEEAAVIAELYENLLQQKFRDEEGNMVPMSQDEILVVAPYNVQVNHLKTTLPEGARVGTVDKFQGQEAQVVIVSMTTSSAEDMPRNLEFLLNKNRLNVAISRAKALTIIVASPALLEVPCRNVEQMRLANTLCWANAEAEAV